MEKQEQVSNLINCLTNNEDERQELWVHYLSGNASSTFAAHLDRINRSFRADTDIQEQLWQAFKNPPSERFQELLSRLSDIEQSVVTLLALGLAVSEISGYKGISDIRIKQVISIIRENDCWEELYGIKKTTNRR